MVTRHKHADLIIQWAENPDLVFQVRHAGGGQRAEEWVDINNTFPTWYDTCEYRIKPVEKIYYCKMGITPSGICIAPCIPLHAEVLVKVVDNKITKVELV